MMILNKLILVAVMGAFLAGAVPLDDSTKTPSKVTASTPTTTSAKPSPHIPSKSKEAHRIPKSKSVGEVKLETGEDIRPKNKTSEELRTPKKFPMNLVERACDVMGCDTVAEAFAALANTVRKATSGGGDAGETREGDSPESTAGPAANPTSGATGNNEMCFDRLGCFAMGSPWLTRGLNTPEEIDTLFRIYTRDTTSNDEAVIVSPIDADPEIAIPAGTVLPEKPTFFLVHGFNDFGVASWLLDLKDAILSKLDANVIIVDWKRGATARISYMKVASNTRVVAAEITGIVQALGEYKIRPRDVHIIGHSLGAHIAGYVGKDFDGAIGRITALDPAQPGFEGHPPEVRLAQSDALFVDVIHTNAAPFIPALGLGMMGAVGDVDFFVNGGAVQPGCLLPSVSPVSSLFTDPVNIFGDMFACSHKRAMTLFTEAIKGNCVFWGKPRKLDRIVEKTISFAKLAHLSGPSNALPKPPAWCTTTCVPMGLLTPLYGVRGNFDISTTADAPFCLKSAGSEPTTSARIGMSGASSLLHKLSGGVLGQRKKRSREQQQQQSPQPEKSFFPRFRFSRSDNRKSHGKVNAITE